MAFALIERLDDLAQRGIGGAEIRLAGLHVRLKLRVLTQLPLQAHGAHGGRCVVAGKIEPVARTDLVLQLEQIELVLLDLAEKLLANEDVADARAGNGNDAHICISVFNRSLIVEISLAEA